VGHKDRKYFVFCSLYHVLFQLLNRKSMFVLRHSYINSHMSGLLRLTGQPYFKKGRSAKVKYGIINYSLSNYLVDRYRDHTHAMPLIWSLPIQPNLEMKTRPKQTLYMLCSLAENNNKIVQHRHEINRQQRWVCWTLKSYLSSPTKCDQNRISGSCKFGQT
jgi:hypothetical protein